MPIATPFRGMTNSQASLVIVTNIFGNSLNDVSIFMQRGSPLRRIGPFASPQLEEFLVEELPESDRILIECLRSNNLTSGRVISQTIFSLQNVVSAIASHPHLFVRKRRLGSIRRATMADRGKILPPGNTDEQRVTKGQLLRGVVNISEDSTIRVAWVYKSVCSPVPMISVKGINGELTALRADDGYIISRDKAMEREWCQYLAAILKTSEAEILDGNFSKADLRGLSQLPRQHWDITFRGRTVAPEAPQFNETRNVWFAQTGDLLPDIKTEAVIEAYLSGRRHIESGRTIFFLPSLDELKNDHGLFLKAFAQGSNDIPIEKIASINSKFSASDRQALQHELQRSKFGAMLRDYQLDGVLWLRELYSNGLGGLLADEMGLGKTIQTLAFISSEKIQSTLIVCPASIIPNWKAEILKLTTSISVQEEIKGEHQDGMKGITIISYQRALRGIEQLHEKSFDMLNLDEGQFVKNSETKTALALRKVASQFRLVLTGTPIENSVHDLWAHLTFANKFLEKPYYRLQRRFPDFGKSKAAADISIKAFRSIVMRRTKGDVELDLPPLTERIIYCEMQCEQRAIYEKTLVAFNTMLKRGLAGRINSIMLEALLRLRQCCSSPLLLPSSLNPGALSESVKIDATLRILESDMAFGRKTIIFSQFRRVLDILEKILAERKIGMSRLDGSTLDREAPVKSFQNDPLIRVFLIGFRAGGFGLNLTAAESIILVDPWWNPAAEQQAFARAHRIGQSKAVFVSKLVCSNTIEEKMLELVASKSALYEQHNDVSKQITADELMKLIQE